MIAALLLAATAPDVMIIGAGNESCATVLQSSYATAFDQWVVGYWSGRNWAAGKTVGRTSDLLGLTGEIRLVCKAQPSLDLLSATNIVYQRLEIAHR